MHVVIVGAGIAGLSTAWALAAAGHAVTLLEQAATIPAPLAASGDHHRIIRSAYGADDFYAAATREAFSAWAAMWRDLGSCHLHPRPALAISRSPGDAGEAILEGLRRAGEHPVVMDAGEAAREFPYLDWTGARFACISDRAGILMSRDIAASLLRWLHDKGAIVHPNAQVTGVDRERGEVWTTDGRVFRGDRVVVTAGAWTTILAPDLAPVLTPHRTSVVYLTPPPRFRAGWAAAPIVIETGGGIGGYIVPPLGALGVKIGAAALRRAGTDLAGGHDAGPWRALFAPLIADLASYAVETVRPCVYTFTRDHRFFACAEGRAVFVSACSGHGYKFGAALGRRIAATATGGHMDRLQVWLGSQSPQPACDQAASVCAAWT